MPRVALVNPSNSSVGFSVTVPRWLYVIAAATPTEVVGDPLVFDEPVRRFDPSIVGPDDVVGIGIHTGNCLPGYRALREAKARGATVVMGGVHPTLVPEECLSVGADAVVTGNGDLVWPQVVEDALAARLRKRYDGGRVPGDALLKAAWRLLDPRHYLMASLQTVSFYSLRAILSRVRNTPLARLPWMGQIVYICACFVFRLLYRNGVAADIARAQRLNLPERMAMSLVVLLSRTVRGRTETSSPLRDSAAEA